MTHIANLRDLLKIFIFVLLYFLTGCGSLMSSSPSAEETALNLLAQPSLDIQGEKAGEIVFEDRFLTSPLSFALGPKGFYYVVDRTLDTIQVFNDELQLTRKISVPDQTRNDRYSRQIFIDTEGVIYLTYRQGNKWNMKIIQNDGTLVRHFFLNDIEEASDLIDIAFSDDHFFLLSRRSTNSSGLESVVSKYNKQGSLQSSYITNSMLGNMAFDVETSTITILKEHTELLVLTDTLTTQSTHDFSTSDSFFCYRDFIFKDELTGKWIIISRNGQHTLKTTLSSLYELESSSIVQVPRTFLVDVEPRPDSGFVILDSHASLRSFDSKSDLISKIQDFSPSYVTAMAVYDQKIYVLDYTKRLFLAYDFLGTPLFNIDLEKLGSITRFTISPEGKIYFHGNNQFIIYSSNGKFDSILFAPDLHHSSLIVIGSKIRAMLTNSGIIYFYMRGQETPFLSLPLSDLPENSERLLYYGDIGFQIDSEDNIYFTYTRSHTIHKITLVDKTPVLSQIPTSYPILDFDMDTVGNFFVHSNERSSEGQIFNGKYLKLNPKGQLIEDISDKFSSGANPSNKFYIDQSNMVLWIPNDFIFEFYK